MTIHHLSTAQLRQLEKAFGDPQTLTESIMLSGVQSRLVEMEGAHPCISMSECVRNPFPGDKREIIGVPVGHVVEAVIGVA